MKTKPSRKKLKADWKLVTKNYIQSVEKSPATKNEKNLLATVGLTWI